MDPAYLAGFFDGEGSIGVYANGRNAGRCLRVQITQNCGVEADRLIGELHGRWGGSVTALNRDTRAVLWQASGANALNFLLFVRPHLRLKAEQADHAISWQQNRPVRVRDALGRVMAHSQEQREADDVVVATLKALKRRRAA